MPIVVLVVLGSLAVVVWLATLISDGMAPLRPSDPEHHAAGDDERREAARHLDIHRSANALKAEFDTWQREAGALSSIALEAGISRHIVIKEVSFLAIASLEDSIERSVVRDKMYVSHEFIATALASLGEGPDALNGVLGKYRGILAAARSAKALDSAELGRLLASRSGLSRPVATELALNVHAILMRAGLSRLDQLADRAY